MEEIMNNEMYVEDIENTEATVVCEENSGRSIGGKILAGILVGVGVGAIALARKAKKAKREERDPRDSRLDAWRIKRLEKKGYIVHRPEVIEIVDDTVECED